METNIQHRKSYILAEKAKYVRACAFESVLKGGKGHLGGAFSCVEILVSLFYSGFLNSI